MTRITTKDLEGIPNPQDCLDAMIRDFVSGSPFNEALRERYMKGMAKVKDKTLQERLNLTYIEIVNAFTSRESYNAGIISSELYDPQREAMLAYYELAASKKSLGKR